MVLTSVNFCVAYANQDLSSVSSLVSLSRSTGLCCNEHDEATHKRAPNVALACCNERTDFAKSLRQILRPLTIPADKIALSGSNANAVSNCSGARDKSIWKPATGNENANFALSPSAPK